MSSARVRFVLRDHRGECPIVLAAGMWCSHIVVVDLAGMEGGVIVDGEF